MKPVRLGISLRKSFPTAPNDTAAAAGNVGVEVVSSVALILHIEDACYGLIADCYEDGEVTVGTRFALDHIAPAVAGQPVDVQATVAAVEGRRVTFAVTVEQDGRVVMRGEHQRAFVAAERFA
ncbi:MAG: hotdog domain-containing protein [Alphaproteobacteria bacterium]|jgi:predicted thioesterase